jgi:mono/diheme cytochrome c family protein
VAPALAAGLAVAALALGACASGSVPTDPQEAKGFEVYNANCVACHGAGGGGGSAPRLIGIADRMSVEQQTAKIADGVPGTAMPAWSEKLSSEDIDAVVAYTRSLQPSS